MLALLRAVGRWIGASCRGLRQRWWAKLRVQNSLLMFVMPQFGHPHTLSRAMALQLIFTALTTMLFVSICMLHAVPRCVPMRGGSVTVSRRDQRSTLGTTSMQALDSSYLERSLR